MANIQIFNNPQFGEVRVATTENGEPLFCLADVAKALGYSRPADAVSNHCKGVVVLPTPTNGGIQQIKFGKEGDVYRLVMKSKLPEAGIFQDWVCDDVLPSIRKHGAYMTQDVIERTLQDPDYLIQLATTLKEEKQKRIEAENKATKLQPLADFAKRAFTSDTLVSISQAAKILKLPFGRNTLFRKLRESGIFFANKNESKQKYCDADYFRMTEGNPIETSKGLMIPVTVYCTQKGLAFINLKFGNGRNDVPQLAKIV